MEKRIAKLLAKLEKKLYPKEDFDEMETLCFDNLGLSHLKARRDSRGSGGQSPNDKEETDDLADLATSMAKSNLDDEAEEDNSVLTEDSAADREAEELDNAPAPQKRLPRTPRTPMRTRTVLSPARPTEALSVVVCGKKQEIPLLVPATRTL